MKITYLILFLVFTLSNVGCQAQIKNEMENKNPLLCDPESGVCELPDHKTSLADSTTVKAQKKPIKIIYFTDPICSSCWGIEPQLRKLKLAYGDYIEIEYRMGGLLPDWNYNSGGISKPSDVAHHWDEVSVYYDMPIDGDVWLEDPLSSSYPPSIAFKAAQMQDKEKAVLFLRAIREMVFLEKKNITKWEYLALAGKKVGLDLVKFKEDYEGKAKELFDEDLKLSSELGVRGFPTMFFTDSTGKKEMVYGVKPFTTFETTLLKLFPTAAKKNYDKTWSAIFSTYTSMTAKEFSELTEMPRTESENYLNILTIQGKLEKLTTKNGSLWTLKKISG
jgi:predicted DsbA family dithiol-disulfide isomerase